MGRKRQRRATDVDPPLRTAASETPSALASERELAALVDQTVRERLDPRARTAWLLFAVEGLPHREVAGLLDLSESRVRGLVSEARATIAAALGSALEGRGAASKR